MSNRVKWFDDRVFFFFFFFLIFFCFSAWIVDEIEMERLEGEGFGGNGRGENSRTMEILTDDPKGFVFFLRRYFGRIKLKFRKWKGRLKTFFFCFFVYISEKYARDMEIFGRMIMEVIWVKG